MIDSGTAIFFSGILATLGWWSSQRAGRQDNRRKHTFEVIKDTRASEPLKASFAAVRQKRLGGMMPAVAPQNETEYGHYLMILDHFEYTCSAVWTGDLDERMLLQSERSRLIAVSTTFKSYIEAKRVGTLIDPPQPSVYENITKLAERWDGGRARRSFLHLLVEWYLMRPYTVGDLRHRWDIVVDTWNRGFRL